MNETVQATSRTDVLTAYITPERLAAEIEQRMEIQISVATLAKWRCVGRGPAFIKVGRHVRYPLAEVRRWLETLKKNGNGGEQ